jgi:hypothetical protein
VYPKRISILCLLLAGCTNIGRPEAEAILSGAELRIVTAHDAIVGRGPLGIAERFALDGKMVAYVNINWPLDHATWGAQSFESRWYMDDKLVVKRETEFKITKSPFHFWSNVLPITLGAGRGRYEIYANGKKLGEKTFEIVAPQSSPEPLRPSQSHTMRLPVPIKAI